MLSLLLLQYSDLGLKSMELRRSRRLRSFQKSLVMKHLLHVNRHDLILGSLNLYDVNDEAGCYRGKLTSSSTSPSFNSVTSSSVMSSPSSTSNTGNASPPRTFWAGARDGDSEANTFAIALLFLRPKVLGGDHGGVLDTDLGVPTPLAGVF